MTIAAAYLTSEGVVLGADSTSTWDLALPSGKTVPQHFNHAQKVFEVGDPGRMAFCTWGVGRVGEVAHRTLAALVGDDVAKRNLTVEDAVTCLETLVLAEWKRLPAAFAPLGYFIGGRDPDSRRARAFEIVFKTSTTSAKRELPTGTCWFAGQSDFYSRVFDGYSRTLPGLVLTELKKDVDAAAQLQLDAKFADAWTRAQQNLGSLGATDIPLRDAVDFVHAALHLTIKAFKFRVGPPVCGGPIEIGFVTTDRSFRWASHKHFGAAMDEGHYHDHRHDKRR